jgi:hypothetical protein
MKHLKLAVVVVVAVLGLAATDAMAQYVRRDPNAIKVESPFKGVVENVSPVSMTVKGEVQLAAPPRVNPNSDNAKSKPMHENIHFHIKGAKLTRDGKACELKDIQKGDAVSVTFTQKEGSDKRVATEINVTKGGEEKK